MEFMVAS